MPLRAEQTATPNRGRRIVNRTRGPPGIDLAAPHSNKLKLLTRQLHRKFRAVAMALVPNKNKI